MFSTPEEPRRSGGPPVLAVVVPAHNEVDRVRACLWSLASQQVPLRVFFSDNASDDGTAEAARELAPALDLVVRTTPPLGPSDHFVSAGRWALSAAGDVECFALLAGDDTWSVGFALAAVDTLLADDDVGAVFPTFVWEGGGPERRLAPVPFRQQRGVARRARALLLPDHRELSNLVYGVYRRSAFEDLLAAWERGGDDFGADYAAAWSLVGDHRVAACDAAVGRRFVREGADLIDRIGLGRGQARGPLSTAALYVRLNLRINRLIARALKRAVPDRAPATWVVQASRAPQWLGGAVRQVRAVRAGARVESG